VPFYFFKTKLIALSGQTSQCQGQVRARPRPKIPAFLISEIKGQSKGI